MTTELIPLGIHCCICLNQGKKAQASTVIKGYAVCEDHVGLASNPQFDIFKMRSESGVV